MPEELWRETNDVSPVQSLNARLPISVTEFGIVTEVKPVHCSNAQLPILVTEIGIAIEVKPVHPKKAL